MKTLPSSEFRKVYQSLDEPTEVTALGRRIGTWIPVRANDEKMIVAQRSARVAAERFNTMPFTGPIPKPSKKR